MKYEGYYTDSELPIKPGTKVRLKKGTMLNSMHPSKDGPYECGRTMTIEIDHVLNGISKPAYMLLYERNRHGADSPLLGNIDWDEVGRTYHENTAESYKKMFPVQNPRVVWAGAGGYWVEADINDVEIL